jgi:hypothetical protein
MPVSINEPGRPLLPWPLPLLALRPLPLPSPPPPRYLSIRLGVLLRLFGLLPLLPVLARLPVSRLVTPFSAFPTCNAGGGRIAGE